MNRGIAHSVLFLLVGLFSSSQANDLASEGQEKNRPAVSISGGAGAVSDGFTLFHTDPPPAFLRR